MRVALGSVVFLVVASACGRFIAEPLDADQSVDGGRTDGGDPTLDGGADPDAALADAPGDGIIVGSKPRLVFVTKGELNGAAVGTGGADTLCETEAAAAGASPLLAGKKFFAWVSTPVRNARDRLTPSDAPYRRIDGMAVTRDSAQFASGLLSAPINVDSTGTPRGDSGSRVWTGTELTGTATPLTCGGWMLDDTETTGTYGELGAMDSKWTNAGDEGCDSENRVYCIEQ
jgi:hypothetical protein